jgi:tyrosyl-tRNA synthetase
MWLLTTAPNKKNSVLLIKNMNAFIEELKWRGLFHDMIPGTEEHLNKQIVTGYVGFDPTADSLHIGSLIPILLLVHLQRAGHKPVALVGGATGMVGDPSGKSAERNLLDETTLQKNLEGIKNQLAKFLHFDGEGETAAVLVNNYDWFKNFSFLNFIRDVGKHITVNYMMSKDSVKKRLEGDNGMSFTEFSYQLVQGYDFFELYSSMNCTLQMGGSDQWGNIVTGTELIRRKTGGEAFAITCPLITKADGGKFGKSEKGNVWLDADKTSPFEFYQFWLRSDDADAEQWIKQFTFLTKDAIELLVAAHHAKPEDRVLQKKLAQEMTIFVHGEAALQTAKETSEKLFKNANAPLTELSADDIENLEGIVKIHIATLPDEDLISFMAAQNIFASKGEARKLIQGGGVSVNRQKVHDEKAKLSAFELVHGKYMLIQKGKKSYYLVIVK